jgi:hypothetical protein
MSVKFLLRISEGVGDEAKSFHVGTIFVISKRVIPIPIIHQFLSNLTLFQVYIVVVVAVGGSSTEERITFWKSQKFWFRF